ncbi:MAG: hypothetical protein JRC99_12505, partial [Deltaproteobacteria bacterium]|nr:hypothetical protein [Deltaproteobacteria bacterium]
LSDLVVNSADTPSWMYLKADGCGRYAGKKYLVLSAGLGFFNSGYAIDKYLGLGILPAGTEGFEGICAMDMNGKTLTNKGFWVSRNSDPEGYGTIRLIPDGPMVQGPGLDTQTGTMIYTGPHPEDPSAETGTGTFARFGDVGVWGDYHDTHGVRGGSWYTFGRSDEAGLLVNINNWLLIETLPKTEDWPTDSYGGIVGSYRLHRAWVDFGELTNIDAYSHHEIFAVMYRTHFQVTTEFKKGGGGSITLATVVPADRFLLVNYSQFPLEPDDSKTAKTVYSAISSHYKPIAYHWEKMFPPEGSTAFEPKEPVEYVEEEPNAEPTGVTGTGGTQSNPQMGL